MADIHVMRHGYIRVHRAIKGLEATVVVTDPDWEPTREFLIDVTSEVREHYPHMAIANVNWIRETLV